MNHTIWIALSAHQEHHTPWTPLTQGGSFSTSAAAHQCARAIRKKQPTALVAVRPDDGNPPPVDPINTVDHYDLPPYV